MNTADDDFDIDFDDPVSSTGKPSEEDSSLDSSDDFDIEIVDDTPLEDQGKPDDPSAFDDDTSDDEAQTYSRQVQKRIDKLTAKANTERRAREKLERENQEAVSVINRLLDSQKNTTAELGTLRKQLYEGEQVYITEVVGSLEAQLKHAQERYKQAYELGQTDDLVKANTDIASITQRMELAKQYRPVKPTEAEGEVSAPVLVPERRVSNAPQKDSALQTWLTRNAWFNDPEHVDMRGMAMAVHTKLVNKGVHPQVDAGKYYATVDSEMRKRFPEYSWPEKYNQRNRSTTVNTSAGNKVKPGTRVKLTKSQVALAETLGLTNEQYAAEVVKQLGRSR